MDELAPRLRPPPIPRFDLAEVARVRAELAGPAAFAHLGETLVGEAFAAFAADVAATLSPRGVAAPLAERACLILHGRDLTPEALEEWAWRVAGNLPRLRAGLAVRPYAGQPERAWYPLAVRQALPARDRRGRDGALLSLRALAGGFCPGTLAKFVTAAALPVLARLALGFDRRDRANARYLYRDPAELVGLRLFGLAEPSPPEELTPRLSRLDGTDATRAYNRKVLAVRFRPRAGARPPRACPQGFDGPDYVACRACDRGFAGDATRPACPFACHPRPYAFAACPGCGRGEAAFDLDAAADVCLDCARRRRLAAPGART